MLYRIKPFWLKSVYALLNESLQTGFPSKLGFYSISLQLSGAEKNEWHQSKELKTYHKAGAWKKIGATAGHPFPGVAEMTDCPWILRGPGTHCTGISARVSLHGGLGRVREDPNRWAYLWATAPRKTGKYGWWSWHQVEVNRKFQVLKSGTENVSKAWNLTWNWSHAKKCL